MKNKQEPTNIQYLKISEDIEIAYAEEGTGDHTLLFLHGLGSNLHAWQKNIEVLKNHFRCIAIDFPGYGKSSKAPYSFSMLFFADSIIAFAKKAALKNITLVGHSMGGQIAVHSVLKEKKLFNKLILLAPAGFETFSVKERAWFVSVFTYNIIKNLSEAQIIQNFYLNFHRFPDDAQFMIDKRFQMRQTREYDHYCRMIPQCVSAMLNEPVFERLKNITQPTLILFGEYDQLIPNKFLHPDLTIRSVTESGKNEIPKAVIKKISEAGHFLQWEQAEQVNTALIDFLK